VNSESTDQHPLAHDEETPAENGAVLGRYHVGQQIGRGGAATVFSGHHIADGTPVAIKILRPGLGRPEVWRRGFEREIRAVAALEHRAIVRIYDHGVLGASFPPQLVGHGKAGSPYFVMEQVAGGSLVSRKGTMTWPELRGVLLDILDGLAHAHARGLLHRDIKPANLLGSDDLFEVKLTDFGLAHALERDDPQDEATVVEGTLSYMSPEQIESRWRDFGPWTDLYQLGCTAWALAAGEPPFGARLSAQQAVERHVFRSPPTLETLHPLPEGLHQWLRQLLSKRPEDRFDRAAGAREALLALTDSDHFGGATTVAEGPPSTQEAPGTLCGLALWGMREAPLVGRKAEQELLGEELESVTEDCEPRLVILEGAAGCGKSRIASWMCREAHAQGASVILKARYSARPDPSTGIGPMLSRALHCQGLDRGQTLKRLRARFPSLGEETSAALASLVELVCPSSTEEQLASGRGLPWSNEAERFSAICSAIQLLRGERPVILWLDDGHLDSEAVGLCDHLLTVGREQKLAVLVLCTVRSEDLVSQPHARARLSAWRTHEQVQRLHLTSLSAEHTRELLRGLLPLADTLIEHVQEHTGGNPLFAVQLIGHWVQQDLLEPGEGGLRLPIRADYELPKHLGTVWEARINALLVGRPAGSRRSLHLAALLGRSVSLTEWMEVCALDGRDSPMDLLDALLRSGLANISEEPDGVWSFRHDLLREFLAQDAGDTAPELHGLCANMLAEQTGSLQRERRGRHLIGAGRLADGAEALFYAAQLSFDSGFVAASRVQLTEAMNALDLLGDDAPEGLVLGALRRNAELTRWEGQINESLHLAEEAVRRARQASAWKHIVSSITTLGKCYELQGSLDEASDCYEEALQIGQQHDLPEAAAWAKLRLCELRVQQGRAQQSHSFGREAMLDFERLGLNRGVARAYMKMSTSSMALGKVDRASLEVDEARIRLERLGSHWAVASCINSLGEIARERGQLDVAAAWYRESWQRWDQLGSTTALLARLNLALTSVARKQYAEALDVVAPLVETFERVGRRPMVAATLMTMLPGLAAAGEWDRYFEAGEKALDLLVDTGVTATDMTFLAETARDICESAHRHDGVELAEQIIAQQAERTTATEE